jgi:uncharacterized membrane protein
MSGEEWSEGFVKEAEESVFECDGKVVTADMVNKDVNGNPARYLMLTIQPTSYTGDLLKKQYKVAKQKNGKWIPFVKAVNALQLQGEMPGTLVGKEFHWKNVHISTFKDESTGEDVDVTSFVPTKLLSGGSGQPAQPAASTAAPKLEANAQKVLDMIRKTGGTTRAEVEKETGMTKGAVISAVGQLKENKLVREEGGALMVA